MTTTWRDIAKQVIQQALAEAKAQGLDFNATKTYVNARYPFGERAYHPYKIWLSEMKRTFMACPKCGEALELLGNGDDGPHEDCWTCCTCGIEYPHAEFPLPKGYVQAARAIEARREREAQQARERALLMAWNAGEPIRV